MCAEQTIRAVALFLCEGTQNMGRWCKDNLVSFPHHRDAEEKVAAGAPTRDVVSIRQINNVLTPSTYSPTK